MKDFNSVRDQDNTFVWHEGHLIFMCIGKAANSSIKAAVLETMGGVDPNVSVHYDERINYIPNSTIEDYGYPCITFVRNPLDRLRSFWRDKIAHRDECNFEHLGLYPCMSFGVTAARVCEMGPTKDTHIARQMSLLTNKGDVLPDHFFKYENLGEDWRRVQAMAHYSLPDLPHYNKSNPIPWSCSYDTMKKIMEHYASDYHCLGYK
jgi:hypothetical protein